MAQQHHARPAANPLRGQEAGDAPYGAFEFPGAQAQFTLHNERTVCPAARVEQKLGQ
ncbi:hypothetical protein D3C86_2135490 [compost metagenome]